MPEARSTSQSTFGILLPIAGGITRASQSTVLVLHEGCGVGPYTARPDPSSHTHTHRHSASSGPAQAVHSGGFPLLEARASSRGPRVPPVKGRGSAVLGFWAGHVGSRRPSHPCDEIGPDIHAKAGPDMTAQARDTSVRGDGEEVGRETGMIEEW